MMSLGHREFTPLLHHGRFPVAKFRRQFKYIFLNGIICIFISISRKFIPNGPLGLAPNRRQTITESNDDRTDRSRGSNELTHLPRDKMAAILADDIFKCIFVNEKFCMLIKISMKFVPEGPIDNDQALV